MQQNTISLIEDLLSISENSTNAAKKFKALNTTQLNFKESTKSWSILECIEHLNLYGDYYLPEIEKQILSAKTIPRGGNFKSGIIGNYFANLMSVNNGKIKKMKSPGDKNPVNSALSITTIERFLKQQERLASLLRQAENIDLIKTKTAISLTKLIRLRLGDTFRFFVYHIERHMMQAGRVLAK